MSFEVGYAGDTGEKEQQILTYLDQERAPNTPGFATDQNKAAVECGWLNFTVVDRAFGTDRDATLRSSRVQSDPFFFLNLARDLMWFDRSDRRWTKSLANLSVFKELAKLKECLVDLGILSGHDLRQRSLSDRELKITLDRELYGLVEKVRLKYLDSLTVDSLDEVIPSHMTIILSALRDGLEIADGEGTVSFPA